MKRNILGGLILQALFIFSIGAQNVSDTDGETLSISRGPGARDYTDLYSYNGNGDIAFICTCPSQQPTTNFTIGAWLTSIVVSSNVATVTTSVPHGLNFGNPITVSGGSEVTINGNFQVGSVPTTTTFTFAVTSPNATYTTAGMKISTTAPRTSAPIWKITRFLYDSGNKLIAKQNSAFKQICDNKGTTSGITAITYR